MTAAPPRKDDRQPSPAGSDGPPPKLGISLVQVVAAALAAATATVAASFLGVTGTVIGAALASVISVTGTAVYSHSLRHTGHRVRERVPRPPGTATRPLRLPGDGSPLQPRDGLSPLDRPTLQGGGFADPTYYGRRRSGPPPPGASAGNDRAAPPRSPWRRLAVAAVAVFAVVLAGVTGIELIAGTPLSDLVRGQSGSGTTLFGTHRARQSHTPQPSRPATTSHPRHAGNSPASTATVTHPPTASRSPTTSPAAPSSTAPPSTSSVPTPSPKPSATSGSPTQGTSRGRSAAS